MPQLAIVKRALRLITVCTGVVPFCQCLTLCPVPDRSEGGTGRHWEKSSWGGGVGGQRGHCQPWSERLGWRCAPHQICGWGHSTGNSKGIVPVSPARNSESRPSTDSMGITKRTGFCSRKKNLSQKLLGTSILQFASKFEFFELRKLCNFVAFSSFRKDRCVTSESTDPASRGGVSLACVVSSNCQHSLVPWSPKQTRRLIGIKVQNYITKLQIWSYFTFSHWWANIQHFNHYITSWCLKHFRNFTLILQIYLISTIIQHVSNHYTFAIITHNMIYIEGYSINLAVSGYNINLAVWGQTAEAPSRNRSDTTAIAMHNKQDKLSPVVGEPVSANISVNLQWSNLLLLDHCWRWRRLLLTE